MLLVTHSCTLAENSYQFYLSISTWVICEFCDVNKAELWTYYTCEQYCLWLNTATLQAQVNVE